MVAQPLSTKSVPARNPLHKSDLLAIALILCGFGVAVLLMPVAHDFAILDDWTYIRNVEHVVAGQPFRPSEFAQATLIVHTYWGALFSWLFGMNFTSPTVANIVAAFIAAVAFYALLRRLSYSPLLSGLGVALLTLNPYFINLSYSFMTELTFLATLLLSVLFYFEGLGRLQARYGIVWLIAGSVFATLAFLTRQFGVALPFATLVWLFFGRALTWRRTVAVALLPVLAAVIYSAWSSRLPTTFISSVSRDEILDLARNPSTYVTRAAHFVYLALFLPGILVPLYGRVRHWRVVLPLAVAVGAVVYIIWQVKHGLVDQGTGSVSELSYLWLGALFRDPTFVYCIGAALTVWLVAGLVERAWPGVVPFLRRRRSVSPVDFLYIVALVLFAGTLIVSLGFLDRYWLPILPFLIAGGLAAVKDLPLRRAVALPAVAAVVLGLFGALVHLDMYDSTEAAWTAARGLVAQGAPVDKIRAGYSWDGYYLFDLALQRAPDMDVDVIGRTFPAYLPGVSDPEYLVQGTPQAGYNVVAQYPYLSRLGGFVTEEMLVLKRK